MCVHIHGVCVGAPGMYMLVWGICEGNTWCICMCVVSVWGLRSREDFRVLRGCSEQLEQEMACRMHVSQGV